MYRIKDGQVVLEKYWVKKKLYGQNKLDTIKYQKSQIINGVIIKLYKNFKRIALPK